MLQVYDKNTISKDEGIGELQIPLWKEDLDVETDYTLELSPVTTSNDKPVLSRYTKIKGHF